VIDLWSARFCPHLVGNVEEKFPTLARTKPARVGHPEGLFAARLRVVHPMFIDEERVRILILGVPHTSVLRVGVLQWFNAQRTEATDRVIYMHGNPVKRGLAGNPGERVWSSFRAYEKAEGGLVPIDFAG